MEDCAVALEQDKNKTKKNRRIIKIIVGVIIAVIVCVFGFAIINSTIIIPANKYNTAVTLMDEGKYDEAIVAFEAMGNYKDCLDNISECKYRIAIALMDEGKYTEAIDAFNKTKDYKDSAELIKDCNDKILEDMYTQALSLMNEQKYNEAITLFESAGNYKDSLTNISECKYCIAVALMNKGEVTQAYKAFAALNDYKDSAKKAASLYDKYQAEKRKEQIKETLVSANVNATVQFGAYEQDNQTSNGAEPIEWTVAKKDGTKILLVSNVLLDVMTYDKNNDSYIWETCSLRKWLNNDFLNAAFSSEEKTMIATTTVSPEKNAYYTSVNPGGATTDKVFILSMSEVQEYCDPPLLIYGYRCELTMYAREKYSGLFDGTIFGEWWIRTPGSEDGRVVYAQRDGDIAAYGCGSFCLLGIRPAVWVDLGS